jgi:hypothetical protein
MTRKKFVKQLMGRLHLSRNEANRIAQIYNPFVAPYEKKLNFVDTKIMNALHTAIGIHGAGGGRHE